MAHFAEIDPSDNNKVLRVIVVSDSDCVDKKGVEKETIGSAFCSSNFGGTWKQTSYNGRIRKNFAEIGGFYDQPNNVFVPSPPYPSWVFNFELNRWEAPVPEPSDAPSDSVYIWSEPDGWTLVRIADPE